MLVARSVSRISNPDRLDAQGTGIGELEARLSALTAGHVIEHDLTSASTAAFPPPTYFLDGVAAAVSQGRPGYTALRGDSRVRQQLAPSLERVLGVAIDPDENLVLTAGTQGGLFAALAALVDEGDTVLVADPEYLCDERTLRFLGAKIRYIPFVTTGKNAMLDLEMVEQGFQAGARLLVFSNPHNPTGSVMAAESLGRLAELAVAFDAWVIADELYWRFVYEDDAVVHMCALPGMRDRCITALGPSKTESASGFRIGVLVGPADALALVTRVVEITTVRAPAYAQYALEHWLRDDDEFVRDRVAAYRRLRNMTVERLVDVEGIEVSMPPATAWLFPNITGLGCSEEEIVGALIKSGILVMPGALFGPSGVGCVRMCFGQDERTWAQVLDRLADTLDGCRH